MIFFDVLAKFCEGFKEGWQETENKSLVSDTNFCDFNNEVEDDELEEFFVGNVGFCWSYPGDADYDPMLDPMLDD